MVSFTFYLMHRFGINSKTRQMYSPFQFLRCPFHIKSNIDFILIPNGQVYYASFQCLKGLFCLMSDIDFVLIPGTNGNIFEHAA